MNYDTMLRSGLDLSVTIQNSGDFNNSIQYYIFSLG